MAEAVEAHKERSHKRRHRESDAGDEHRGSRKKRRTEDDHGYKSHRKEDRHSSSKRRHNSHDHPVEARARALTSPTVQTNGALNHHTTPSPQSTNDAGPFVSETRTLYLPVPPAALGHTLQGLCMIHLSANLLKYYAPLSGILLSYTDPRLSEYPPSPSTPHPPSEEVAEESPLLISFGEYAVSYIWLTADFTIFRPTKGCLLEGQVNLVSEDHVGLILYNFFSASIDRRRLPRDWEWVSGRAKASLGSRDVGTTSQELVDSVGQGYWVDGRGERVGGRLEFWCRDVEIVWEREETTVAVVGTLLDERKDEVRVEAHRDRRERRREHRKRRNEDDMEEDEKRTESREVTTGSRVENGSSAIGNGDRPARKERERSRHRHRG